MPGHHFLSYSSLDAQDFARQLHDALEAGSPSFAVWLDKIYLKLGQDWDEQISDAIRVCDSLLFVMTRDSVNPQSTCKLEWTRALKYKKPIIPLLLHPDAEPPFRLAARQYLDFTGEFAPALAKLREHLSWLTSPEGTLQELRYRLEDAQRELSRTNDSAQRSRIETDIALLEQQIAEQQHALENPQSTSKRTEENIAAGLERERQRQRVATTSTNNKFINPPPGVAPSYFQGRHIETKVIGDFLKDEALRLLTVVGRGGIGKTALVCRVLKALENGQLPDDGGPLTLDGIVYLSATGTRRLNVPNLFADLCKLLPDDTAKALEQFYKNPQATTEAKMRALLEAFPNGRTVVLLDNFEDVLNSTTRNINDTELDEALRALLNLPQHGVKMVITTRLTPHDLALLQPARQRHLHLEEGLESPYTEQLLREMDADGKLGLKTAPDKLLKEARERTRGFPRALEALFAILSADRDTSLQEILADTEKLLPENVVEALVGEAFSRLNPVAQQVMQALAVYNRPVTANAVDYLLQPYSPVIDSAPVLKRLVNMHFVRKEAGRYYLHPIDREYAFGRVPRGEVSDRNETETPKYTQFALLYRGAEYFKQTKLPREQWKTIDDLAPQLAEFGLRCTGQDFDNAAEVLVEIDIDYLEQWGYYRVVLDLHERLQGKISNIQLNTRIVFGQGNAYNRTGKYHEALKCLKQALASSSVAHDRQGEGKILGMIGSTYLMLAQPTHAIQYYELALGIAREIQDKHYESHWLGDLGGSYAILGQTAHAIDHTKKALVIARDMRYLRDESLWHANLGVCYSNLGENARAIDYYRKALKICIEIDFRIGEGRQLVNLAENMIYTKHYEDAIKHALASLKIAHEISSSTLNSQDNIVLALAYSGLALCESNQHIPAAMEAYRAARALCKDAGIVNRVLRLFDALAVADEKGILAEVRKAAAGE